MVMLKINYFCDIFLNMLVRLKSNYYCDIILSIVVRLKINYFSQMVDSSLTPSLILCALFPPAGLWSNFICTFFFSWHAFFLLFAIILCLKFLLQRAGMFKLSIMTNELLY